MNYPMNNSIFKHSTPRQLIVFLFAALSMSPLRSQATLKCSLPTSSQRAAQEVLSRMKNIPESIRQENDRTMKNLKNMPSIPAELIPDWLATRALSKVAPELFSVNTFFPINQKTIAERFTPQFIFTNLESALKIATTEIKSITAGDYIVYGKVQEIQKHIEDVIRDKLKKDPDYPENLIYQEKIINIIHSLGRDPQKGLKIVDFFISIGAWKDSQILAMLRLKLKVDQVRSEGDTEYFRWIDVSEWINRYFSMIPLKRTNLPLNIQDEISIALNKEIQPKIDMTELKTRLGPELEHDLLNYLKKVDSSDDFLGNSFEELQIRKVLSYFIKYDANIPYVIKFIYRRISKLLPFNIPGLANSYSMLLDKAEAYPFLTEESDSDVNILDSLKNKKP